MAGVVSMATSSVEREPFRSILCPGTPPAYAEPAKAPPFLHDLELDEVRDDVVASWADYDLGPFFDAPLDDEDAIAYRQEVARDLENAEPMQAIASFGKAMAAVRRLRDGAKKREYRFEAERWLLGAAGKYADAVEALARALSRSEVRSRGLRSFHAYLVDYVASSAFRTLAAESRELASALAAIRYCLRIDGGAVTVRAFAGETDYGAAIEAAFERFRREPPLRDYRARLPARWSVDHVQAQILERVAWLYPEVFAALDAFASRHRDFVEENIERFDREVHFYVAYLAFVDGFRRAGLSFCYPSFSRVSKELHVRDTFDAALGARLLREKAAIVCNDVDLHGAERILVVTGPNQGGKTTFARTIGQLCYLARLGLPVPGKEARLFLCDGIFTHFEREERIETLRGKLQDDLLRIRAILDQATPRSLLVVNEIFSSTTPDDASWLSREILAAISRLDAPCVWVTFLAELSAFDAKTVSVVGRMDPDDPVRRTYRLERRAADGLAYALAVAAKHQVTYDGLTRRLPT